MRGVSSVQGLGHCWGITRTALRELVGTMRKARDLLALGEMPAWNRAQKGSV